MSTAWYNPNDHKDGNVIQANTEEIGKSIKAIGNGIVSAANTFSKIQTISNTTNNWNLKFQYAPEETYATTQPVFASGPVRTSTFRTAGDTMNDLADTAGFRWHVDYNIEGGRLFAYDADKPFKPIDQKTIDKANKKSIKLLKEWLSDAEYKYLMEDGNLELPSQHEKDTIYIVNKDPMKRIGIKKRGKIVEKSLCIHASHAYATGDVLLANIMLLKTDEKKFLEIANVHDYIA